MFLETE